MNGVCLHLLQKEILRKGEKPCILMVFTIQMQGEDACESKESQKKAPLSEGKGTFQGDTRKIGFVSLYAGRIKRMTGSENDPVASIFFAEVKLFISFL